MAAAVLGHDHRCGWRASWPGSTTQVAVEEAVEASVLLRSPASWAMTSLRAPAGQERCYYDLGAARRAALHRRAAGLLGGERSLAHRVAAAAVPTRPWPST